MLGDLIVVWICFFFSSRRRHTRCALVTGVQTCALPISNPQYNLDVLPTTLAEYQINHTYIAELGGRRPRQRSIDPQLNGFWQNQSFHNYADYALSSDFHTGLRRLLELSQRKTCAIMCSEAVWWRCHQIGRAHV